MLVYHFKYWYVSSLVSYILSIRWYLFIYLFIAVPDSVQLIRNDQTSDGWPCVMIVNGQELEITFIQAVKTVYLVKCGRKKFSTSNRMNNKWTDFNAMNLIMRLSSPFRTLIFLIKCWLHLRRNILNWHRQ